MKCFFSEIRNQLKAYSRKGIPIKLNIWIIAHLRCCDRTICTSTAIEHYDSPPVLVSSYKHVPDIRVPTASRQTWLQNSPLFETMYREYES